MNDRLSNLIKAYPLQNGIDNLASFNKTLWREIQLAEQDIAQPMIGKIASSCQKRPLQLTAITIAVLVGVSASIITPKPLKSLEQQQAFTIFSTSSTLLAANTTNIPLTLKP